MATPELPYPRRDDQVSPMSRTLSRTISRWVETPAIQKYGLDRKTGARSEFIAGMVFDQDSTLGQPELRRLVLSRHTAAKDSAAPSYKAIETYSAASSGFKVPLKRWGVVVIDDETDYNIVPWGMSVKDRLSEIQRALVYTVNFRPDVQSIELYRNFLLEQDQELDFHLPVQEPIRRRDGNASE